MWRKLLELLLIRFLFTATTTAAANNNNNNNNKRTQKQLHGCGLLSELRTFGCVY
jgi:hypothetical protein